MPDLKFESCKILLQNIDKLLISASDKKQNKATKKQVPCKINSAKSFNISLVK